MITSIYDYDHHLSQELLDRTVDFLFVHLGHYGDPRGDIRKAAEYALGLNGSAGGFIGLAFEQDELVGAVVVNRTGMESYIPANLLVYIAIHDRYRGLGLGRELLEVVIRHTTGGIALHVEADNPARHLYERLGFTHKYLEMRFDGKGAE